MSKSRAIRIPDNEDRQIEEFLKGNPFFDFSTLARMAILEFIKNPKITVRPVKGPPKALTRKEADGQPQ
jgi:hypothetical protein